MRKVFDLLMQTLLYVVDPYFRATVKRKGPNDKTRGGETVKVVLTHSDGTREVRT